MEFRAGEIVSCSNCGRRSRVTSLGDGDVSFELLDAGAFPGKCGACGAVICAACISQSEDVCPKCGAKGKWKLLGEILDISAENARDSDKPAEIFQIVAEGDMRTARSILVSDPGLEFLRWDGGRTLLHAAVMSKSKDMVEFVLEFGVRLEATDENGQDALMYAVSLGLVEIASLLLKRGADPNIRNKSGATPLVSAALKGSPEMISTLIEAGAGIEQTGVMTVSDSTQSGHMTPTPLLVAVFQGRHDNVEALLNAGANVKVQEPASGWGPLHFAVVAMARGDGNLGTLKRLLDSGAEPHVADFQGLTALDWARRASLEDAIKLLEGIPKKKWWQW